jgi:4-alpha-glucanotransferase
MSAPSRRRAGLLIPLFSFPSSTSWGIGEIGDVAPMVTWLAAGHQHVLQLLPLNEMAPGQQSPYSAISGMAIDPIFISLPEVPEFESVAADGALSSADFAHLVAVRGATHVDYARVRALKQRALTQAFDCFWNTSWRRDDGRARALRAFLSEQAWWIDDYALFRAVHHQEGERPWFEWPTDLRTRDQAALEQARDALARDVLFYGYLQWLAAEQWSRARCTAAAAGVALFGDLPFMVDGDSADVWARQHQFRFDVTAGAPPDAFSTTGQDWGLPVCRWDVMAADGFSWLRDRARRSAALYDGYRVDHLVGFYRTYGKPRDGGEAFFTPSEELDQVALGETVLDVFNASGAEIIAEDLGIVPTFVRQSLARKSTPGFCIMRWEREWDTDGQPFRDPGAYPVRSVAASGTHDTDPLAIWWETATDEDRESIAALPSVAPHLLNDREPSAKTDPVNADVASRPYDRQIRDALLEALFASSSELLLLTVQDVFGWRDRINEPATVTPANWTFRLPWPCDRLADEPEAQERRAALERWAEKYGRDT